MGIGISPKGRATGTKDFCFRQKLGVDFQADDSFISSGFCRGGCWHHVMLRQGLSRAEPLGFPSVKTALRLGLALLERSSRNRARSASKASAQDTPGGAFQMWQFLG